MAKKMAASMLFALLFVTVAFAASVDADIELKKAAVYRNDDTAGGALAPVMLLSYEGEDYFLTPNEQSKKLEGLIERTINVTGSVTQDGEKRNVVTIKSFTEAFN